jgi:hypothetical protein
MSTTEEFHALWRSSAFEAVPYTDDFPEALLVLPELIDGSIGQGQASKINLEVTLKGTKSNLKVRDNGVGIKNERRLLQWAAQKAADNLHRNGHGTKKCLTKWEQDYTKANWTIKYRLAGKNLQIIKGPFKGRDTDVSEDETDQTTLMPSGVEISIDFDTSVLAGLAEKPDDLFKALKELLQTRYSEAVFERTEFVIDIGTADPAAKKLAPHSSKNAKAPWHSFKACVEKSVEDPRISKVYSKTVQIEGGQYVVEVYYNTILGNTSFTLKKEFPKYGLKSMKSSRAHVSLDGRMIEAIPIYQLMGRDANHNDFNGFIVFVNFTPNTPADFNKLPSPCTTKVSLYENDPVLTTFKADFAKMMAPVIKDVLVKVEKEKAKASKEKEKEKLVVPAGVVPVPPSPGMMHISSGRNGYEPANTVIPTPLIPKKPLVPQQQVQLVAPVAQPVAPVAPVQVAQSVVAAAVQAPVAAPKPSVVEIPAHQKLAPQSQKDLVLTLQQAMAELQGMNLESLALKASNVTEKKIAEKIVAIQESIKMLKSLAD